MKLVMSFGYAFGKPSPNEFDAVYDARRFRNPYGNPKLRNKDGRDQSVRLAVLSDPDVMEFILKVIKLNSNSVAIGCMGGKHRSVAIAEVIARRTGAQLRHRDLSR